MKIDLAEWRERSGLTEQEIGPLTKWSWGKCKKRGWDGKYHVVDRDECPPKAQKLPKVKQALLVGTAVAAGMGLANVRKAIMPTSAERGAADRALVAKHAANAKAFDDLSSGIEGGDDPAAAFKAMKDSLTKTLGEEGAKESPVMALGQGLKSFGKKENLEKSSFGDYLKNSLNDAFEGIAPAVKDAMGTAGAIGLVGVGVYAAYKMAKAWRSRKQSQEKWVWESRGAALDADLIKIGKKASAYAVRKVLAEIPMEKFSRLAKTEKGIAKIGEIADKVIAGMSKKVEAKPLQEASDPSRLEREAQAGSVEAADALFKHHMRAGNKGELKRLGLSSDWAWTLSINAPGMRDPYAFDWIAQVADEIARKLPRNKHIRSIRADKDRIYVHGAGRNARIAQSLVGDAMRGLLQKVGRETDTRFTLTGPRLLAPGYIKLLR